MNAPSISEDTQAAFGLKTKGRILSASLDLFNRCGFERTTTAELAEASGVLEGTLWYHYKSKKELPLAHLDALEARLDAHLQLPLAVSEGEALDRFFAAFDLLWDFRYILREPIAVLQDEDHGRMRLRQIYANVEQRTEDRLNLAAELGILDLTDVDVRALAVTCFLTGRYWLDYVSIRYEDNLSLDDFRTMGIAQFALLLTPYMTDYGRRLAEAARKKL